LVDNHIQQLKHLYQINHIYIKIQTMKKSELRQIIREEVEKLLIEELKKYEN
jgi:hypothetical protein